MYYLLYLLDIIFRYLFTFFYYNIGAFKMVDKCFNCLKLVKIL